MIIIQNHLGKINFTKPFFTSLIGKTVTNCFGVVEMNVGNAKQTIMDTVPFFAKKNYIDKGVDVTYEGEKLSINLHITVMYGINVSSIVKSIQNKVRYVVEEQTNLEVLKVNVFVDGIKS